MKQVILKSLTMVNWRGAKDVTINFNADVTTIMGSGDTKLMIQANPKKVYDRAKETLLAGRDAKKGYILGTSCETPPYTIPGQLLALTRAARDFGTYGTW